MKIKMISVTENGRLLSERIAGALEGHETERFCFHRHSGSSCRSFSDLSELVSEIWEDSGALIFVCACGIAVRSIAPHIRSKFSDPAVIAADDCGKFVIPLLSGHVGGANALAEKIASAIGAQAAVTTATDVGGRFSPDSFAAANGLIIGDPGAAKEIASAVLAGERIGLASEYPCVNMPPEIASGEECRCGIYIGEKTAEAPFPVTLQLMPRNIVIGIGCRRDTSAEAVEETVLEALGRAGISAGRICSAATVDIKADEEGILGFCRKYGIELSVFTPEELMDTPGEFTASPFVEKITGTDNVCERSAVRLSGGALVMKKYAGRGVTAAAAEIPVTLDMEKKVL